MGGTIPHLSLLDTLAFNLGYVVPLALQGTFTRNPFWIGLVTRFHPDPAGVRFVQRLRERYGNDTLATRLVTAPAVLVLGREAVRRVLDNSPTIYADGQQKRDGMRVFQPNAVTISRGEDWRDRRRFNEDVLDFGAPIHAYADAILGAIREEVGAELDAGRSRWSWDDFDRLFARLARRVILGRSARDDKEVTDRLHALMREANRPIRPRRSRHFAPFYRRLQAYLSRAEPGSLAHLCRVVPATERTRVANQIPHWLFAMWETLGGNVARALAAILAHPEAEARVRYELADADLATPAGIAGLAYLEGCIQEAMRLWPTTPLLVREAVIEDVLGGGTVRPGTQVLIWNAANHRDRSRYPLADTFAPEAWRDGSPSPLFNHLSSGPQVCAGRDVLLFMAKAVVATMLRDARYTLVSPDLDPSRPLPHAFNAFDVELVAVGRQAGALGSH